MPLAVLVPLPVGFDPPPSAPLTPELPLVLVPELPVCEPAPVVPLLPVGRIVPDPVPLDGLHPLGVGAGGLL